MNLRCLFRGHVWRTFHVDWLDYEGNTIGIRNHICTECGEPQSGYLLEEQRFHLRNTRTAWCHGLWCATKAPPTKSQPISARPGPEVEDELRPPMPMPRERP